LYIKTSATPTEYRCLSVSLIAENVRLGNKYFLTSTSTSTSTWHASTSTSTRKLYLITDQVPVQQDCRLVKWVKCFIVSLIS